MPPITRIRVPATWASDDITGYRFATADFTLGPGRCGLTVNRLGYEEAESGSFVIMQGHTNGSTKAFIYPASTLTGRIEVTYGEDLGDDIEGDPEGFDSRAGYAV